MKKLTIHRIESFELPLATAWLLSECMQARGKQELWMQQRPEVLQVLREQAIVQSVESSNRIEGLSIAADRLRPVVLGKARPRDRSEEELVGYRKALDWIFSRKRRVEFSPEVVLKLHALAQGGMTGDAGRWKSKNNEIIEILPNNQRRVRFMPTSASETPDAMKSLCTAYQNVIIKYIFGIFFIKLQGLIQANGILMAWRTWRNYGQGRRLSFNIWLDMTTRCISEVPS